MISLLFHNTSSYNANKRLRQSCWTNRELKCWHGMVQRSTDNSFKLDRTQQTRTAEIYFNGFSDLFGRTYNFVSMRSLFIFWSFQMALGNHSYFSAAFGSFQMSFSDHSKFFCAFRMPQMIVLNFTAAFKCLLGIRSHPFSILWCPHLPFLFCMASLDAAHFPLFFYTAFFIPPLAMLVLYAILGHPHDWFLQGSNYSK